MDTVALKKSLEQEPTKCNPLAKFGPLTIFDIKFLEHSHTQIYLCTGYFCDRAELSNCEKAVFLANSKIFTIWCFREKVCCQWHIWNMHVLFIFEVHMKYDEISSPKQQLGEGVEFCRGQQFLIIIWIIW